MAKTKDTHLSRQEQETTITFDEAHSEAILTTFSPGWIALMVKHKIEPVRKLGPGRVYLIKKSKIVIK